MMLDEKDLYKELGENFRLTLHWRELLFAGFLAISGALGIGLYTLVKPVTPIDNSQDNKTAARTSDNSKAVGTSNRKINNPPYVQNDGPASYAWIVPSVGAFLAFSFLLLDRRCHELLLGNYKLGHELEKWKTGYYFTAMKRGRHPKEITHTAVLQSIYIGAGVLFLTIATILFFAENPVEAAAVPLDARQTIAAGLEKLLKSAPGLILSFFGYKLLSPNFSELNETHETKIIDELIKFIRCRHIAGWVIGLAGVGLSCYELLR